MTYGYNNPYYYPVSYWNAMQQQNYQHAQAQTQPIRVVLVSNEDEAKATPAESNGNPLFFYNKSMNKVYLKQINPQTGAAPLQIFSAEQPLTPEVKQPDEMTRYNTIIEGINGLYRLLSPQNNTITTQPPIMDDDVEKPKKASK